MMIAGVSGECSACQLGVEIATVNRPVPFRSADGEVDPAGGGQAAGGSHRLLAVTA
jgi:hypothetical protein